MSNYCPICGAVLITAEEFENQRCELCKLALDKLVEKKLGGVKSAIFNAEGS